MTSPRLSAKEYASAIGVRRETVERWCRNAMKPETERKRSLPPIVARQVGRIWKIDVERTERAQSLTCGTSLEKELTRRSK